MSATLLNEHGNHFGTSNWGWVRLLALGMMYGWVPRGTLPPNSWDSRRPWNPRNYTTNDGQTVTRQDALSFSIAIESSLPQLKETTVGHQSQQAIPFEKAIEQRRQMLEKLASTNEKNPALAGFSQKSETFLLEFINFCRLGQFNIW